MASAEVIREYISRGAEQLIPIPGLDTSGFVAPILLLFFLLLLANQHRLKSPNKITPTAVETSSISLVALSMVGFVVLVDRFGFGFVLGCFDEAFKLDGNVGSDVMHIEVSVVEITVTVDVSLSACEVFAAVVACLGVVKELDSFVFGSLDEAFGVDFDVCVSFCEAFGVSFAVETPKKNII